MKTIAIIPARYAATRFPGKLMQVLGNKTIIRHTYENTKATLLFDEVIVATDNEIIFNEIIQNGGYAVMSRHNHESGSDRIAEAIAGIDVDIVVNVQGDEPFVKKEMLQQLLSAFDTSPREQVQVASLMYKITDEKEIINPNHVKVIVDKESNALLFSRSVIPFHRNKQLEATYYKHIGIYAFQKEALMNFTKWEMAANESIEQLEQLRYLENGVKIKMMPIDDCPVSIDTPEDLEKAKLYYNF